MAKLNLGEGASRDLLLRKSPAARFRLPAMAATSDRMPLTPAPRLAPPSDGPQRFQDRRLPYRGAVRTLRDYVVTVRPLPRREVYLRTEPLVGEQAQIDWAYVGKLPVDGGERALWLFVMVLSHSRALWGEFVLDLSVHSLCRSLVRAACAFGGLTRQWLFDNPKTVVLERRGDAVRFHPALLSLCGALRVQPRLCAVARPQHKGRVERAIRYLRDRFLAGRIITGVAEGNRALDHFIAEIAHARPHPVLAPRTVADVPLDEKSRLLPLPDVLPSTDLVVPVNVDSQAFVRLDTNRYSVPTQYAYRSLRRILAHLVGACPLGPLAGCLFRSGCLL